MSDLQAIIKLARPHQYVKNGFVFIGPLFAQQWDLQTLLQAFVAFAAFCIMASAVYVLNDLMDIEADRQHPVKCNRPLPSGKLSLGFARLLLAGLVVGALILSALVSSWVVVFVATYFIINIFYSWKLKHVVILDVFIISGGFMLRIFAGTVGLGIAPSQWLLLCGLMVTLFLGFSKRRAELLMLESAEVNNSLTRKVLDDYSPAMLEQFIGVTAAGTVLSYGLYTLAPETVAMHNSSNLIYSLPFVVYGIFRYLFLLHQKARGNDTASDLITDRHLLITVVAWGVTILYILG